MASPCLASKKPIARVVSSPMDDGAQDVPASVDLAPGKPTTARMKAKKRGESHHSRGRTGSTLPPQLLRRTARRSKSFQQHSEAWQAQVHVRRTIGVRYRGARHIG